MKKMLICLVALVILLTSGVAFANNPIKIFVNGTEIKTDVQPFVKDGRTMVPIRFIADAFGQNVTWNEFNQEVVISSPQVKFKAYHDKEDFLNDLNTALECLTEADNQLSEALQENTQSSNIHIIRALAWIQKAQNYENNLSRYKDEAKMHDEYKKLANIRSLYWSVANDFKNIGFPITDKNLDNFSQPQIQKGEAYFELADFKKELGR